MDQILSLRTADQWQHAAAIDLVAQALEHGAGRARSDRDELRWHLANVRTPPSPAWLARKGTGIRQR